jgi:thiosulfate/3-mercaptopyruvate sulfurtransferase
LYLIAIYLTVRSVFFDIDACVGDGGAHNLPHMLPTEAAFSAYAGAKLGLSESDPIVIYDSERSAFSAPRVWWTLRVFGAKNIGILDGGLQEYIKHNLPTHGTAQPLATPAPAKFTAKLDHGLIKAWSDVQANISTQACTVRTHI